MDPKRRNAGLVGMAVAIAAAIFASQISSFKHTPPAKDTTAVPAVQPKSMLSIGAKSVHGPWPFIVDTGTLMLIKDDQVFNANGSAYALNPSAKSSGHYQPIEQIEKKNPDGTVPSLSEIMAMAGTLRDSM